MATRNNLAKRFSSSIRYWEARRSLYNAALSLWWFARLFLHRPTRDRTEFGGTFFQGLFVWRVLANTSPMRSGHLVDVVAQMSAFGCHG